MKRELSLTPELDSVSKLADTVAEVSADDDWTPDLEYKVALAVEEIGMNIVSYAGLSNDQAIQVTIDSTPESVTVVFSDSWAGVLIRLSTRPPRIWRRRSPTAASVGLESTWWKL